MDSGWRRGSLQVPESGIRCLFLQRELHAKHHRVITASAQRRSTHTRRGSRVNCKTILAITQSPCISNPAGRQCACRATHDARANIDSTKNCATLKKASGAVSGRMFTPLRQSPNGD
ncbi:hypothetical protein V5799_014441 [Amblyomma americanum]|uniref:Uncharacterized protein n=1 Tax=Amblyomma americanum TaxID=6943 RepID=A0AAQ4E309_AMBAM